MNKIQQFCMNALRIFMMLGIGIIFVGSLSKINFNMNNPFIYKLIALIIIISFAGGITIKSKLANKFKVLIFLGMAGFIRMWWFLNIKSVPVSDFKNMYDIANALLNGDNLAFRDFGYLSRFPHLTCTTLYMALMIKLFPITNLFAIKIVNVILSILSVFLLYRLSKYFVKQEKTSLVIMLLATIFPPFITYSSTYCTENIAIPFYLLTMLCFFNSLKGKTNVKYFLTGILLAFSDMFRGVGVIFLIAFCIYIFVFETETKIKKSLFLISGMVFTTIYVSLFLISVKIIEKPLWQGAEPSFATLLLKGSNVENGGMWNLEDAQFVDKNLGNENLAKECFEISFDRIASLTFVEKILFYGKKFITQWTVGDFSGSYWAATQTDKEFLQFNPYIFQVIYVFIIMLSFISLIRNNRNKETSLLYILLCGFGLLFLMIETQSRYAYVISWVFLVLAIQGVEDLVGRIRNEVKVFKNKKI